MLRTPPMTETSKICSVWERVSGPCGEIYWHRPAVSYRTWRRVRLMCLIVLLTNSWRVNMAEKVRLNNAQWKTLLYLAFGDRKTSSTEAVSSSSRLRSYGLVTQDEAGQL